MTKSKTRTSSHRTDGTDSHVEYCRRLARVTKKRLLGGMALLELAVPGWGEARAGQFVLLQSETSRCFLGRALSVCSQTGENVSFLVSQVGEGTREVCELTEGCGVWVLGPLGNGFDIGALSRGAERVVLVGGGVGIAPLPLLLRELRHEASRVVTLAGFRDAAQAEAAEVLTAETEEAVTAGHEWSLDVCTEDGSMGTKGLATDLLKHHIRRGDHLGVCGPDAMARAVWEVVASFGGVEAWFSLESVMACGVGSCHGCVTALADGSYARVCREGPVFEGKAVFGA